jgi:hypothetical protein
MKGNLLVRIRTVHISACLDEDLQSFSKRGVVEKEELAVTRR